MGNPYFVRRSPVTGMNLDCLRRSVASADAEGQLQVYRELESRFRVLRVKNTFANGPEDTLGMMQILVNFLFEPRAENGMPLTYAAMAASPKFDAAVERACEANGGRQYGSYIRRAAKLFSTLSGLGPEPIKFICEIQLHLDYYLEQRKKTHLWFKILRAQGLKELTLDCSAYR